MPEWSSVARCCMVPAVLTIVCSAILPCSLSVRSGRFMSGQVCNFTEKTWITAMYLFWYRHEFGWVNSLVSWSLWYWPIDTGVTEGPAAPAVRGGADTRGAPAGRPPSVGFFLMNLFLHLMASEGRPRYPLYPWIRLSRAPPGHCWRLWLNISRRLKPKYSGLVRWKR